MLLQRGVACGIGKHLLPRSECGRGDEIKGCKRGEDMPLINSCSNEVTAEGKIDGVYNVPLMKLVARRELPNVAGANSGYGEVRLRIVGGVYTRYSEVVS